MNSPINKGGRIAEVLLVEDNENDVVLTRAGFEEASLTVNLHHVSNGQQCLDFLRKQGAYKNMPDPDLILLDLNMPVMNGLEVLQEMEADEHLQGRRVVVLTTSNAEEDIVKAYGYKCCSSYITKPVNFNNFMEAVSYIGEYWITLVVKP